MCVDDEKPRQDAASIQWFPVCSSCRELKRQEGGVGVEV